MEFQARTIRQLAKLICGNFQDEPSPVFLYRASTALTQFFENCDTDYTHRGETRGSWVESVLQEMLKEIQSNPPFPPDVFLRVIRELMEQSYASNEDASRPKALEALNGILKREGFEAYYAEDSKCYLRHVPTASVSKPFESPHRPLSTKEIERRNKLSSYLDSASEDDLIEQILLPLFRQLNFHRVTAAGHKDKALEYGKDVWMRYRLPTQHYLYFGLQAKIGKIDSAGKSEKGSANIAEILNQVTMMLGHDVFDPETNKRHLPDHAFIVAGGTITKAARNWLGQHLDQSKRSQIVFMDREDILNLYVVSNLALPRGDPLEGHSDHDHIPF